MKIALTIAGSDSGGGAGIQADLKTFHRFGVFGTSVIAAVTAQNTNGVRAWQAVDEELIAAQIEAVAADLRPAALKSGMLGSVQVVRTVASALRKHGLSPYVLDPVMVASSGDLLVGEGVTAAIASELLPLATLVTPNIPEAAILCGHAVNNVDDMKGAARMLVEKMGAAAALVKGGHLSGDKTVDVLFDGTFREFSHSRVATRNTHGTGCTLSAAIAANLAHGATLAGSVQIALDYVHRAILLAPQLGEGHGPLNHFA
jgi:hydroxymethylpyrimidine/phosphomethylpyrimidine kinase